MEHLTPEPTVCKDIIEYFLPCKVTNLELRKQVKLIPY
jgi:hypothetical protein